VIALQEVHPPDTLDERWSASEVDRAGYQVVYGPTLTKPRGPYGNALLSRHPVVAVRRIDLSLPGREPRGALDVTIRREGEELRVIATHLGLRARERCAQVTRLLEHVGPLDQGLLVLLGDINEWQPRASSLRCLEARFGSAPCVRSFPSRRPIFALDRVWTHPRDALIKVEAHRTALSAVASDHVPVIATVRR
jgi:endonuclease/exonuclease/phosphatase family metal-dependent hydrolase